MDALPPLLLMTELGIAYTTGKYTSAVCWPRQEIYGGYAV